MGDNPPDNDNYLNNAESVQGYLDLLLTQTTEESETQVVAVTDDRFTESELDKVGLSAGNNVALFSSRSAARSLSGGLPSQPQTKPWRAEITSSEIRPYADPVQPLPTKPLTLKTVVAPPIPVVAPAPSIKIPLDISPPVASPLKVKAPPQVKQPIITPDVAPELEVPSEQLSVEVEVESKAKFETTRWENGRPVWAQERFECLLFSVAGLTLAVPLVELGSIMQVNEELTFIFGQSDWFMGLLPVKGGNLQIVNTAKVVMPERYVDSMANNFAYAISINAMDWGLAVDSVSNSITLEPDEVRWRTERNKRPWLAGTVVEHMCSLVDVSQLAAMFEEASNNK